MTPRASPGPCTSAPPTDVQGRGHMARLWDTALSPSVPRARETTARGRLSCQRPHGHGSAAATENTASSQRLCFISCWDRRPMAALLHHFTKKVAPPSSSLPRPGPSPQSKCLESGLFSESNAKFRKGPEPAWLSLRSSWLCPPGGAGLRVCRRGGRASPGRSSRCR